MHIKYYLDCTSVSNQVGLAVREVESTIINENIQNKL